MHTHTSVGWVKTVQISSFRAALLSLELKVVAWQWALNTRGHFAVRAWALQECTPQLYWFPGDMLQSVLCGQGCLSTGIVYSHRL